MKKIILILGLIIAIHMETKAQVEKQFTAVTYLTASKSTPLPGNNLFSKNRYSSTGNEPDKDHAYYMKKSKSQRTVGWVTLSSGVVLSGIGLLIANSSNPTIDSYGNLVEDDGASLAAVLTIAGAASGIVSIPFMIMAHANRNKAKLLLKNQQTGFGVPPNVNRNITGITMSIPIGK